MLQEEIEVAVKALKNGKSAGVNNIPVELIKAGGEHVGTALTAICNKIWWPEPWIHSLVITIPEKGGSSTLSELLNNQSSKSS